MSTTTPRSARMRPLVPVNPLGGVAAFDPERQRWAGLGDGTAKLLISAVAERDVDLLRVLLRFLDRGVEVGERATPIRLTSEGALVSRSGNHVSCTLVVRPITTPHGLASAGAALHAQDVQGRLGEVIREAQREAGTDGEGIEPRVWPLSDTPGPSLFAGHQFHELRFGVVDDDAQRGGRRLAEIASQFTGILKAADVPIAYLDFPFSWSTTVTNPSLETLGALRGSTAWVRVAVGLPFGLAEPIEMQLAARAVALSEDSVLCLYNPASQEPTMGQRFEIVAIAEELRRQIVPGPVDTAGRADAANVHHVFVEGHARPGFIADVFACADRAGVPVQSGSMTVLQGHTVANWSVASEEAAVIFEDELYRTFSADPSFRVAARSDRVSPFASIDDATAPLWVGWRCPEQPGVMAQLLETLDGYLTAIANQLDMPVDVRGTHVRNVDYLVARVLERDNSCAGKFRIALPEALARACLDPGEVARLTEELLAALRTLQHPVQSRTIEQDPSAAPAPGIDIVIGGDEPALDPWATLVFGSPELPDDDSFN